MMPSKSATARVCKVKKSEETKRNEVTLTRGSLAQALIIAADVMQNNAAVAKSNEWKDYYRVSMKAYRHAADMITDGARFTIKG